jgi:hypothetical protein
VSARFGGERLVPADPAAANEALESVERAPQAT